MCIHTYMYMHTHTNIYISTVSHIKKVHGTEILYSIQFLHLFSLKYSFLFQVFIKFQLLNIQYNISLKCRT